MKKTMDDNTALLRDLEEMLDKELTINMKFVEEEIVINVRYVEKDTNNMMVIDSGAPVFPLSSNWLENYMKDMKVDDEEVERSGDNQRFRLRKTLYISVEKVKFPVWIKTDRNNFIKK